MKKTLMAALLTAVLASTSMQAAVKPRLSAVPEAAADDHDFTVKKIGDSVVDFRALVLGDKQYGPMKFSQSINGNAFQQDAVATHRDYQYVGYYDGQRRVCIARRKLPEGKWEIIRFEDYRFKANDAHNTISIGICPKDGTIHMAFDHHVHELHYRVSKKGAAANPESATWDASLFGPITSELEKGSPIRVTYPRFWQTPDGELQFCWRQGGSGNGDRMLADYDPETGTWMNTRQIDSRVGTFKDALGESNSRCSYPNGYAYGPKGRLHATWVWRESSQGGNHDLIYAYSEDRGKTWRNSDGQILKGPPHLKSLGITVVDIGSAYGLMNTHGQAVDSRGRIHAVMWHCTDKTLKAAGSKPGETRWGPQDARRYHHYWRDGKGQWQHRQLPGDAGSRPKVFIDKKDNAYLIFGGKTSSSGMVSAISFSKGDLVIMAATADSKWTDWKVIHTEKGPFDNEMLGDLYRWKKSGILSVMVQQGAMKEEYESTLRILDFVFKQE